MTEWQLAGAPAGHCDSPEALASLALQWRPAKVPGTVAQCIPPPFDYDACDWWYRTSFVAPRRGEPLRLRFDGLATLATAWLNGVEILSSRNMFLGHAVDIAPLCRDVNQLVIVFRSLRPALAERRTRPRWKTRLVAEQSLRWLRTSLLGHMPGWTPPLPPIGPWRPVRLDTSPVASIDLHPRVEDGIARLDFRAVLFRPPQRATLVVAGVAHHLEIKGCALSAELRLPGIPLWWPHTHGEPSVAGCILELELDGETLHVDCGALGFKQVAWHEDSRGAQWRVNGVPVFCRGACWTPLDVFDTCAGPGELRRVLELARDAGANMLRVGGTMAYESDAFYRLCDELGILVWQDFMFASMDYPTGDAAFRAEVETEARQQLQRLRRHACVAAWCGGSEIAQQAAMLGLPASHWTDEFFAEALPRFCGALHPGIPYFPSTPWGGALPFHVGTGIAHYFGVGAYRRPFADAKTARVRFAAECLAFANPPEQPSKDGVPRDNGADWDFADVRDHYLGLLFGVDPAGLNARDPERYRALSRVVSGEAMQRVFSEWRNPASGCAGGLVWLLHDLSPGAGWGVIDATGRPKAAFWYLKRAWAPVALRLTDEGLDGLLLHLLNDRPLALAAQLELELFSRNRCLDRASREVTLAPRSGLTLSGDALLGHFSDSTAAYRFGPPKYDVIAARLRASDGTILAEDFHFPAGLSLPVQSAAIDLRALWEGERPILTLRSPVFLQSVRLVAEHFIPDDNYFHLAPAQEKRIAFAGSGDFEARVEALNLAERPSVRAARRVVHELG